MRSPDVTVVLWLLRFLTHTSCQAPGPASSRVLVLQESGAPSARTFARLLTPLPSLPPAFTVCYRIKLYRFREEGTLLSYALDNTRDNELRTDHRVGGLRAAVGGEWVEGEVRTPVRYWSHFCLAVHLGSGNWTIFRDGEETDVGVLPEVGEARRGVTAGGVLVVGQEQDSLGGGFHRDQSFSGEFTELNIWSGHLEQEDVRQLSDCEVYVEGDVLTWSRQSWQTLGGVAWVSRSRQLLCQPSRRTMAFFPERYTLTQATGLCQRAGGRVGVPSSPEENKKVYDGSVYRASFCSGGEGNSYLWLGAHDSLQDGAWLYFSGEPINWEGAWRGVGPNGGHVENCAVMQYDTFPARWSDIACLDTYKFCVACEYPERPTFTLAGQGVCDASPFNSKYVLEGKGGGRPEFLGYFHSDITWNAIDKEWVLRSLKVANAEARWKPETPDKYPFGTRPWKLTGDVCGFRSGDVINLTLSVCSDAQYTCADGTCINLKQRCDSREDCPDGSDERRCPLILIPTGYRAIIPPPPPDPQQPLPVHISIDLLSFPSILAAEMILTATLELRLRWRDPRLNLIDLKEDANLNQVPPSVALRIWTPTLILQDVHASRVGLGGKAGDESRVGQTGRLVCVKEGVSYPATDDMPDHSRYYKGSENSLVMVQVTSATYTCHTHLGLFPFDVQVCWFNFTLYAASPDHLALLSSSTTYSGSPHLLHFSLDSIRSRPGATAGQVGVEVRLGRRSGHYLLTAYLPTCLVLALAYSTFFITLDQFLPRVFLSFTSLFLLSSLYSQTCLEVPHTSYFKLVDVWYVVLMLLVFGVTLLHIMIQFTTPPYGSTGALTRVQPVGTRPLSRKHGLVTVDTEPLATYPSMRPALHHDPTMPQRPTPTPTHLLLLMAGRIAVPSAFIIFCLVYIGAAKGESEENVR